MRVPILKVPFSEEDKRFIGERVSSVLDSGMLTLGANTREFEELFAASTLEMSRI